MVEKMESDGVSRMLEASREMAEGARGEQTGDEDSQLGEEGWGENEIAPGQQLSDYRSSYQPLPDIQIASGIAAAGSATAADSTPVVGAVVKHSQRDVRVVGDCEVEWCGLQNMGNSCYMNAGLQCICSVPNFAAYFLGNRRTTSDALQGESEGEEHLHSQQRDEAKTQTKCRRQLNSSFQVLLKKLWCGQFSSLHPKAFKMSLGLVHPPFAGTRQQDCQEFLAVLLDHIHEQLAGEHSPPAPAPETVVSQTFQGQLKNTVQCMHCQHMSTKVEPFVYLSLPLPGAHQRHIEVYWVPAVRDTHSHLHITRLMVTVLKQDSIAELKIAICDLLAKSIKRELLVTAEVKGGCISRPLGDGISLKQLTFTKGEKLYCFEMLSLSELMASIQREDPWAPSTADDHTHQQRRENDASTDAFGSQPFISNTGNDQSSSPMEVGGANSVGVAEDGANAVVMEWRSCCICLEEMLDSDLLTHPSCGAVVCSSCLQSSMQHSSQQANKMPCPICSMYVLPSEAFCPLTSRQQPTDQQVISFLQVVLLMRDSDGSLFGHPVMLHLPCQSQGALYYKTIASLLPECLANAHWALCLTDAKAKYCSRCSYESFCSGCPLQRSTGSEVKLKPGDHVAVCFSVPLTSHQLHQANFVDDHSSYLRASTPTTLTLKHCLEAFTKSEDLGDDNPWFCSSCQSQQKATRTLAVHHIPPVLIIHLKRFMYHSGGAKLEMAVEFPLRLEASDVCSTHPAHPLRLTAVVCHFGTLQGGHYTAFVRHPSTGTWLYCNDSKVSQCTPSSREAEAVYILFYQRLPVDDGLDTSLFESWDFDDTAEMRAVEQLMLSVPIAPATASREPTANLKRTNSDPDINKSQTPLIQPHKRQCNMSPF